jgi:hypothetical protein
MLVSSRLAAVSRRTAIDKKSLWGGVNIKKGELFVKEICAKDVVFV